MMQMSIKIINSGDIKESIKKLYAPLVERDSISLSTESPKYSVVILVDNFLYLLFNSTHETK